ncbi:MAG: protein-export chaperone SecB [Pseudomonadota bacterium]
MAEEENNRTADSGGGIKLHLQRIYLKDASLESPQSPAIFRKQWQPEFNVDLGSRGRAIEEDDHYEVSLRVTVTASQEGETVFLTEVEQAGIFVIEGADKATLDRLLGSYCPNVLFPYAREAISDLVARASFPQFLLNPVNFDVLYEQQRAKRTAEAETASGDDQTH